MAGMFGADVAQLRTLAQQFDRCATQLESSRTSVSGSIASSVWRGTDAERFRQTWSGQSVPRMAAAAQSLRDAATSLRANADQQELASAADGGGGASASAGTGSAPSMLAAVGGAIGGTYHFLDSTQSFANHIAQAGEWVSKAAFKLEAHPSSLSSDVLSIADQYGDKFAHSANMFKAAGSMLDVAGRAFGAVGAGVSIYESVHDAASGDMNGAMLNMAAAGFGVAAMIPIPPIAFIGAAGSFTITAGEYIASHPQQVADVVNGVGHAAAEAGTAVEHAASWATSTVDNIIKNAPKIWPF